MRSPDSLRTLSPPMGICRRQGPISSQQILVIHSHLLLWIKLHESFMPKWVFLSDCLSVQRDSKLVRFRTFAHTKETHLRKNIAVPHCQVRRGWKCGSLSTSGQEGDWREIGERRKTQGVIRSPWEGDLNCALSVGLRASGLLQMLVYADHISSTPTLLRTSVTPEEAQFMFGRYRRFTRHAAKLAHAQFF